MRLFLFVLWVDFWLTGPNGLKPAPINKFIFRQFTVYLVINSTDSSVKHLHKVCANQDTIQNILNTNKILLYEI